MRALRITPIVAALVAAALSACHSDTDEPTGALYSCEKFTVYPDSIVSDSLTLAYREGHGMALITPGQVTFHSLETDVDDGVALSGSDTLLVDLFNNYRPMALGECTLDELALLALPADAKIVEARLDSATTQRGYLQWPITAPDAAEVLARSELLNATGRGNSRAIRREAEQIVALDKVCCDGLTGLTCGITRREIRAHAFPVWMNVGDMATVNSLRANLDRVRCIDLLVEQAGSAAEQLKLMHSRDSLIDAIDTYMWVPDLNSYCSMLYGAPMSLQSPMIDNNTQALSAIWHVCDTPIAEALVANAPMLESYVPAFYPVSPRQRATTDRGVTTALMAIAAARCGNQEAFSRALAQLVYQVASHKSSPLLLRGVVLRGLAGIDFTSRGMTFSPYVPEVMDGTKQLSNIPYRDAVIDLTITGWGDVISTFAIDGKPIEGDRLLPANLKGRHSVAITLVGSAGRRNGVNSAEPATLTPTPAIEWTTSSTAQFAEQALPLTLFLNGELIGALDETEYRLNSAKMEAINFVPTADGRLNGFSTATHLFVPMRDSVVVDATKLGKLGARSVKDKKLAKTLLETTRYKNTQLTFRYTAPAAGRYYIKVSYLNGQGIVNPERRYALRALKVNGADCGIIVFPQLSPLRWTPDLDWQQMSGSTVPVGVDLHEGLNTISLDYYSPQKADFNHDNNSLIPKKIILYHQSAL